MLERSITAELLAALADTPVALLTGPRQAGKSTLVERLAAGEHAAEYLTLDTLAALGAAEADPEGFVERLEGPVVIDEVQRVPELLLAIKRSVDRDRRPGRFLLTGSARVLLLPTVSETLAGRVAVLELWPLSQGEIVGVRDRFVDRLFTTAPPSFSGLALDRGELIERVTRGGFPEARARADPRRRERWFADYVTTVAQREIRDLSNVDRLSALGDLLTSLALRARAPLNKSDLSGAMGMPRTSVDRYLALLEQVFLVRTIPGWHRSPSRQLVKSPKLLVVDAGLMAHLLGAEPDRLRRDDTLLGSLVEAFVGMELVKQLSWSQTSAALHHLRSSKGAEVDFVLETRDGRVAAVEVKASSSVRAGDARHLATLRDDLGDRFVRGVVLYAGDRSLPFGDRLDAWPLASLWAR